MYAHNINYKKSEQKFEKKSFIFILLLSKIVNP